MAYEPGGYADELGNRYEGRWVVRQLLRLVSEDIRSVIWEPSGEEEPGVDLIVTRADGTTEFQQCKARNAAKEFWDVASLTARGVLTKIRQHLDRDPRCAFRVVTGVPGTTLGDICESARNSANDSGMFYEYQVQKRGTKTRKEFDNRKLKKSDCETQWKR